MFSVSQDHRLSLLQEKMSQPKFFRVDKRERCSERKGWPRGYYLPFTECFYLQANLVSTFFFSVELCCNLLSSGTFINVCDHLCLFPLASTPLFAVKVITNLCDFSWFQLKQSRSLQEQSEHLCLTRERTSLRTKKSWNIPYETCDSWFRIWWDWELN